MRPSAWESLTAEVRTDIGREAASLAVRLGRAAPDARDDPSTTTGDRVDKGIRRWRALYATSGVGAFERRLSWDGLDTASLGARLRHFERVSTTPPDWTDWLSRFVASAGRADVVSGRVKAPLDNLLDGVPFGAVWVPVLATCSEALAQQRVRLEDTFVPPAASAFAASLVSELSQAGELALLEAFRGFRVPGEERGLTRHNAFVQWVLDGGWIDIWKQFPVLARTTVTLASRWVQGLAELVRRLERDREILRRTWTLPADRVVFARPALSDSHHGGRRVVELQFEGGLHLAYKPRDVMLEALLHGLFDWAARRGLAVAPSTPPVLSMDGYGWSRWVDPEPCLDAAEVTAYFRRAGSLLCFANLLGGVDLHGENIVATRHGPVLIDAEAMLQPTRDWEADEPDGHRRSCLATGLLSLVHVDPAGHRAESGGLRTASPRTSPVGRRVWEHLGSDGIGYTLDTRVVPATDNVARLGGSACEPEEWSPAVAEGFAATWRFAMRHRDELLVRGGPLDSLGTATARVLFRQSDQYAALLYLLDSPGYQRDGVSRSVAIDSLNRVFAHEARRPNLWPLVADEQLALEAHDVPRFTIAADRADVLSRTSGEVVRGHFVCPGIEAVRMRFAQLDEAALDWQQEQIESVLPGHAGAEVVVAHPGPTGAAVTPHPPDILVHAAEVAASELLRRAQRDDRGHLRWPGTDGRLDLYNGQAGPVLALAALATVTAEPQWRDAANAALEPLREAAVSTESWSRFWPVTGGASGAGSAVVTLAWVGRLLDHRASAEAALTLARRIPLSELLAAAEADVERGLAGWLLALLVAGAGPADPSLLSAALAVARRLVELGVQPDPGQLAWPGPDGRLLAGFAHGAAGIASALGRLHRLAGEPWLRDAVHSAWRFERAMFLPAIGNWPLVRAAGGTAAIHGWCHGAPGVALARVATPVALWDAAVQGEIDAAMASIEAAPRSRFDHLCCGNLARAEALLTVGRRAGHSESVRAARELALELAGRIVLEGPAGARTSGLEEGRFVPGFFQGVSGIIYQLLRTSSPDRLPSVLAFDDTGGDW